MKLSSEQRRKIHYQLKSNLSWCKYVYQNREQFDDLTDGRAFDEMKTVIEMLFIMQVINERRKEKMIRSLVNMNHSFWNAFHAGKPSDEWKNYYKHFQAMIYFI